MIRGVWDSVTLGWVLAASLLPVAAAAGFEFGPATLFRAGLALLVIALWQGLFHRLRGTPFSGAGAVTALALALLAAGPLSPWQIVLAASFGCVLAELLFGGWGRNALPAGAVAAVFAALAFPEIAHPSAGWLTAAATGLALALLVAVGLVAAVIPLAAALAWAAVSAALGQPLLPVEGAGSLAFAAVYLAADPVTAPTARSARAAHGALFGGLAALFALSGSAAPQAAAGAALLAAIFAPLIDHAAIAAALRLRRFRHG